MTGANEKKKDEVKEKRETQKEGTSEFASQFARTTLRIVFSLITPARRFSQKYSHSLKYIKKLDLKRIATFH